MRQFYTLLMAFFLATTASAQLKLIPVPINNSAPGVADGGFRFDIIGVQNPMTFDIYDGLGGPFYQEPIIIFSDTSITIDYLPMDTLVLMDAAVYDSDLSNMHQVIIQRSGGPFYEFDDLTINAIDYSYAGDCEGSVSVDFSSDTLSGAMLFSLFGDSLDGINVSGANNTLNYDSLCEWGFSFMAFIADSIGTVFYSIQYNAFPTIYNFGNPLINIDSDPVSSSGICDGKATVEILDYSGFSLLWDNGDTTLTTDSLCEGLHELVVVSDSGLIDTLSFYIPASGNVIYQEEEGWIEVLDSILTEATELCGFDYFSPVDTFYIASIEALDDLTCSIDWVVVQNGNTYNITETYFLPEPNAQGWFAFGLDIYCEEATRSVFRSNRFFAFASTNGETLSISDHSEKSVSFKIYPNPSDDVLNLQINGVEGMKSEISIYDLKGRLIQSQNIQIQSGSNNFRLNLDSFENGSYLLMVRGDDGKSLVKRFVKQ